MTYPILDTTAQVTAHPRLHNAWVDAKGHFGAVGDGVTDDTHALQLAIDATESGGTLFIPPGTYNHTGLTMTTGTRLVGAGANVTEVDAVEPIGSVLHYTPITGTALAVTDTGGLGSSEISHIGLTGAGLANNTVGLFLDGTSDTPMRNGVCQSVYVKGFGTGIKTSNIYGHTFLGCYAVKNTTGLHVYSTSNANSVIGGAYRENVTGIHLESSAELFVAPGVVVESNTTTGLIIDGQYSSGSTIGGHYEANPTGIKILGTDPFRVYDTAITGAIIDNASTACITVDYAALIFINNVYLLDSGTIILGDNTQECQVSSVRNLRSITDNGISNHIGYPQLPLGANGAGPFVNGYYINTANDAFTRANSNTTLGSATLGGAWDTNGGTNTWGISSNKAYYVSGAPVSGPTAATLDPGYADVKVEADITISSTVGEGCAGVVLRYDGTYWIAISVNNQPTVAGVSMHVDGEIVEFESATITEGGTYTLTVIANGSNIEVQLDGAPMFVHQLTAAEQTHHLSGTRVGMAVSETLDDGGSRIDNFDAWAVPAWVTSGGYLYADSGLGVGNTAAATTLGTVTDKMEVFDADGASIGFVPIYDAIT